MAQLQTLLQLGVMTLPEIVERRLRFIQLTQESEGGRERDGKRGGLNSGKTAFGPGDSICLFLVPLYSTQVLNFILGHVVLGVCLQRLIYIRQQAFSLRQRHLQVLLEITAIILASLSSVSKQGILFIKSLINIYKK